MLALLNNSKHLPQLMTQNPTKNVYGLGHKSYNMAHGNKGNLKQGLVKKSIFKNPASSGFFDKCVT